MKISVPPARSTAGLRGRLRRLALAVAVGLGLLHPGPASAASAVRVLVWTFVSEPARQTMSQTLWSKDVTAAVGGQVIPFLGPEPPTLADCRAAKADYSVAAPFDLRPTLPGLPSSGGRVAALSRIVVTNCATGTTTLDRSVTFESDAPSASADGDFESAPETVWAVGLRSTLAKVPFRFDRVAHVVHVDSPFVLVDLKPSRVQPGDRLIDFARADHGLRTSPIVLTIIQTYDTYVQAAFSSFDEQPAAGDLVEVEPTNAASPRPSTSP